MWFGKKAKSKSETELKPEAPACQHKYKGFDWYAWGTYHYSTNHFVVKVYKPYVCSLCGHRKDVLLERREGTGELDWMKHWKDVQEYPNVKSKAVVEEQIADMQLVDVGGADA